MIWARCICLLISSVAFVSLSPSARASPCGLLSRIDHVQRHACELRSEDSDVASAAAETLGSFGPRARPAIPALIDALSRKRDGIDIHAAEALVKVGSAAVPHLSRTLSHSEADVRMASAWILARMGKGALPAVPKLLQLATDHDLTVRKMAVEAICRAGRSMEAVPLLVAGLKDDRYLARRLSVSQLASLGAAARGAQGPLIRVLATDGDPTIRDLAAVALARIGKQTAAMIRAFVEHQTEIAYQAGSTATQD
jgi:HEAT repeat protein